MKNIIPFKDIKAKLIEEYDLQVDPCESIPSFMDSPVNSGMALLSQIMSKFPDKIQEIEESISDGEDFRSYFADAESLKELKDLHETDVDKFYRILRKEELFLNTCLQTFGFNNYIISLNPKTLFDDMDFD